MKISNSKTWQLSIVTIPAILAGVGCQTTLSSAPNGFPSLPPLAAAQTLPPAITMDQVVRLSRSGVGDEVIMNQISKNGIVSLPNPNDLVLLKQSGVSERVIESLQSARPANTMNVNSVAPHPRTMIAQPTMVMPPDVIIAEPVGPGPPIFFQPAPFCGW